jgi:ATP-dependent Clp protease ATP-binding subunit ClpC
MKQDDATSYETMKDRLKVAIEKYFRPEFLNRLDDVIVFHSLNKENLKQIVDIELSKVRSRLADRGMELVLTDDAKAYIIDKGYNPDYGARPLRRAIENMVEDPLAEQILRGTFKGKDTITVVVDGPPEARQIRFDATSKNEPKALAGVSGAPEPPAEAKK